jgi:hypothetical protein
MLLILEDGSEHIEDAARHRFELFLLLRFSV